MARKLLRIFLTPLPDTCAEQFPLLSIGGWAEGPACADPGARTPIGASGNLWLTCLLYEILCMEQSSYIPYIFICIALCKKVHILVAQMDIVPHSTDFLVNVPTSASFFLCLSLSSSLVLYSNSFFAPLPSFSSLTHSSPKNFWSPTLDFLWSQFAPLTCWVTLTHTSWAAWHRNICHNLDCTKPEDVMKAG